MLEMPGTSNICLGKLQSSLERGHGGYKQQGHRPELFKPLELTSQHHVSRMPDMELQNLMFDLLGFCFALA
jgi:hypothetical protein